MAVVRRHDTAHLHTVAVACRKKVEFKSTELRLSYGKVIDISAGRGCRAAAATATLKSPLVVIFQIKVNTKF